MFRVCKNRSPDQFSTETIPLVCDIRDVQHSFDLERMYNEKQPVKNQASYRIISCKTVTSVLHFEYFQVKCSRMQRFWNRSLRSKIQIFHQVTQGKYCLSMAAPVRLLVYTAVLEILWTLFGEHTPNITNKCYILVPGPVLVHQHKEQNRGHLPRPQQPTIA